jgi:hypothetical protein
VANLAIWKGIRYYYASRGRQVPAFRDFLDPDSKAWDYPEEQWTTELDAKERAAGFSPRGREDETAQSADTLETLTASTVASSNPIVQAATTLAFPQPDPSLRSG